MTKNAGSLVAYQASQRQKTINAIAEAMKTIGTEMSEHGYYPHNGGRLSKLEVLRRAKVSAQTLKNATHEKTADFLDRWLSSLKKTAPTLKVEAQDAKGSKIAFLEKKLVQVVGHYDRFKLEYNDLLQRFDAMETESRALRNQLARDTGASLEFLKTPTSSKKR
jgi:hypothetical protein